MRVRTLIFALAFAIFFGNMLTFAAENAIVAYVQYRQEQKFLQFQRDLMHQYQQQHPDSKPETKDYPGGANL